MHYKTGLYVVSLVQSIRKELPKDKKLMLEMACETVTGMEVAATDSSLMAQTQKDPVRVNHLQQRRESQLLRKSKVQAKQEKRCYCCTKLGHTPNEWKFKNAQRYGCGKTAILKTFADQNQGKKTGGRRHRIK